MDSGPGAWRMILYHWISTSTRIWGRHKTELFDIILQPQTHSGMEFANDDDDDMYFGITINTKNYLLFYQDKSEQLRESRVVHIQKVS